MGQQGMMGMNMNNQMNQGNTMMNNQMQMNPMMNNPGTQMMQNQMNPMMQQQMMQNQMMQQQMLQQQLLQQQMMNAAAQANMAQQANMAAQMNNILNANNNTQPQAPGTSGATGTIPNPQPSQPSGPGFCVIFRSSGQGGPQTAPVMVQCMPDDKVQSVIDRYRSKSGDNDPSKKFIFNAKNLSPSLTVAEAGIANNANIFVVTTKGVKGAF